MSDLVRLRQRLYGALLATPLLAACPGGGSRGDTTVQPPQPPDAAVAAEPLTPRDDPWPDYYANCDYGGWCGPVEAAASHRDGDAEALGCPVVVVDREQYAEYTFDEGETAAYRDSGDAATCCYRWFAGCTGGKPYGAPIAAVTADGDTLAEVLAARWLAAAQAEHASVAAFARTSLELLAVAAPPELIAGCHRAALDELRHARACLTLASRHAGRALALGAVPALAPRPGGLRRVARDTYLEGCLAETHGAVVAVRALAGCEDPEAARVLRGIARDEARHAELAWRTLAWTVEVGGDDIRAVIAGLARTSAPGTPGRAADPRLGEHGQLDDAGLDCAAVDAWRELIAPMTRRLLARAAASPLSA